MMRNSLFTILLLAALIYSACQDETPISNNNIVIQEDQPVTDYDGNIYRTVRIGNQTWMAENLRTTHYSDGTPVENFRYNNDDSNAGIYGRLYKWPAAMRNAAGSNANPSGIQGVSPNGWHLPSDAEWEELITYLGGGSVAGAKLKTNESGYWINPQNSVTNESLFSVRPAGFYRIDGEFIALGESAVMLTTYKVNPQYVRVRTLSHLNNDIAAEEYLLQDAVSIRCLKD